MNEKLFPGSLVLALIARAVGLLTLTAAATTGFGADSSQFRLTERALPGNRPYAAGEVVIQFKPAARDAELAEALRQGALSLRQAVRTRAMQLDGHPGLNVAATKLPMAQALAVLNRHPAVEFAEPNWIYTHQATPSDPYYTGGYLWGLYGDATVPSNAYGSQAAEAWAAGYTGSKSVYVGVIDEGVQVKHPDLAANIWTNPHDPADGLDNDNNGYVDDVNGWNFFSDNNEIHGGTGDSHGTHVAGTIGAVGGNGQGVVGVNWNVTIIPAKFLGPSGGTVADAVAAIDYFVALKKQKGLNIAALNCSWGGGGYSQSLHDAAIRAAKEGILIVTAAGNGDADGNAINIDTTPDYPSNLDTRIGTSTESAASYDAVISATAIDINGAKPAWANYGVTNVDLGAPGVSIWSTIPGSTYAAGTGTSMAAPHVSGAVALLASTYTSATADQIKKALLGAVLPTSSLTGKTVTGGRLNLSSVVAPAPAPSPTTYPAPTGLTATPGDTRIALKWNAASGATGYILKRSKTNGGPYGNIATTSSTAYSDTGLVNGRTYYYVVSALYSGNESANSAQVGAVPGTTTVITPPPPPPTTTPVPPAAPSNLAATAVSSSQINLVWTDNSSDETGFKIERKTGATGSYAQIALLGAGTTTYSNSGLTANTQYFYRVQATNQNGDSAFSNEASATTSASPPPPSSAGAPSNLTATAGVTRVSLTWTGVSGAISYNIKRSKINGGPYGVIAKVTSASFTDTGLVTGRTYYYVVSANTSSGETANSNQAQATAK